MCTKVVLRDFLQNIFWFVLLQLIVQKGKTAICLVGKR